MPASTSECADALQGPGTSFLGTGTPAVRAPIEAKSAVSYGPLIYLALGTFAIGTEGFMIAAILPSIADSLSVSVQMAGQLVTVFTLVFAVSLTCSSA